MTQVTNNDILNKKYTYDGLGRLVREDNRDLNKTFVFTYDNAGNILSREEYNFTIGETLPTTPDSIYTYSYDSSNKNHLTDYKIEINGENPITESVGSYEIGNPWTYRGKSATWKNVHRLASYDGITFDYNYAGIRTKKTVNGVTTKYAINDNNIIAEQKGTDASSRITYFYGLDGVTAFKYANAVYYYKKNFLGDIIGIYDSSKQLVAKYVYDAWGNHKVLNPNNTENTSATFIGNINPFRYRSYYFDVETGFYYLQSRYYDPEVGRFISMDSVEYLAPETINGLNLYAYCLNNPVMGYDPKGTWDWKAVGRFVIGSTIATIGFSLTLVTQPLAYKPILSYVTQYSYSATLYGINVAASAFNDQIYNDMASIGWNPFNTNEEDVINSKSVSFYRGQAVVKGNFPGCASFGVMFVDNGSWVTNDVIKHEHGHFKQMGRLGIKKFAKNIAIPSIIGTSITPDSLYHSQPWEVTADVLGNASGFNHVKGSEALGWLYFFSILTSI